MKKALLIVVLLLAYSIEAQKKDFKHINFKKADSIAALYEGHSLKNVPILTYKLTQNLDTQVEQFRAIYTWVCNNIESDHNFGATTLRKRRKLKNDSLSFSAWNKQVLPKVFKRLLNDKKTICSGYAYLLKEMAILVDIKCEIIDGYNRATTRNVGKVDFPNHSWNAVKLNDKWYLVDATMASGYFDIDNNRFVKDYNDGYFLTNPNLFIKRNYPLKLKWILMENAPKLNQFVEAPIVYGSTFKHAITPILPENLITKAFINDEISFKFKVIDKNIISKIRIVYSSGLRNGFIELKPSNYVNGCLSFKHRFMKKGRYDLHVMVNTDIVASYTLTMNHNKKA